ncbi:hypothetical protein [Clostridium weizhouense]|uniref:Uncharacterized protein n=1 Tax=Clostridium weizhouense TaxID=2859781 RepID=A0ABS7AV79_9CLOT|nr:hypothetical protein [Clostridium weizhouense]MBW6411916.1 hypothetical protein [Clostridium weizhouense]
MSDDGGAYHNIPTILDESIMSGEPYVIRANGRVEFLKKGSVGTISAKTNKYSVKEGIYHMTKEGNSVKHKLFVPEDDWARFAKRWGLPGYDLID